MPSSAAAVRTVRHNLPASLTSIIGRERELVNLKAQLASARLLTLTGVGGCGKTRLALELGRTVQDQYPDGVWLVGRRSNLRWHPQSRRGRLAQHPISRRQRILPIL